MASAIINLEIMIAFDGDLAANRLDLRPAAELLGVWPGSNLFA